MAFQERMQRYECDNTDCRLMIEKSSPVIFHKGKHFCSPKCLLDWQDSQEENRRREEELQGIADLGIE